jgi:hypothetical protein
VWAFERVSSILLKLFTEIDITLAQEKHAFYLRLILIAHGENVNTGSQVSSLPAPFMPAARVKSLPL